MREERLEIMQVPEPDKQQAVIMATIRDDNGIRHGIGAAYNDRRDSPYNPQALLDKARSVAIERAMNNNVNLSTKPEPSQAIPQERKQAPVKQGIGHKHNTKPGSVTEKQLHFLGNIANERNKDLSLISTNKFGVRPDQLSSEQANHLVQYLKNGSN